jgi:hypothetical protein
MATERQIHANRANAKRSTGPKTSTGRRASSRNAFRHGLSSSTPPRQTEPVDVGDLAEALIDSGADEIQIIAARKIALTHLELLRIRAVRSALLASLQSANGYANVLCQLRALDRYESIARGKRRLATKCLGLSTTSR